MILTETDKKPELLRFDVVIVAVGYERRCRWVVEQNSIDGAKKLGLQFGFLTGGAFDENCAYFRSRGYEFVLGLGSDALGIIEASLAGFRRREASVRIFVDISSMSREMIANVTLAIASLQTETPCEVTISYAPSKFEGEYQPAPIKQANPIKPALAGWSSSPGKPLGALFGLGCEPGLALGALQYLEPDKAWVFRPKGIDRSFDTAMKRANEHLADIFDVSFFDYQITSPTDTRGRVEALLNSLTPSFRLIAIPFGPKIFAWLCISTIAFTGRSQIGAWAFSSKEHGEITDRQAEGTVIWHTISLAPQTE